MTRNHNGLMATSKAGDRWDDLFGIRERGVAAHKKQQSNHRKVPEIACGETNLSSGNRAVGEHDDAPLSESARHT